MEKFTKTKRIYFKELDDTFNNMDKSIFQIGGKNLFNKLNELIIEPSPSDGKIFRTKFKLNKNCFDFNYNSLDDIILPVEYEYGEYKQGNFYSKNLDTKKKKNKIDIIIIFFFFYFRF